LDNRILPSPGASGGGRPVLSGTGRGESALTPRKERIMQNAAAIQAPAADRAGQLHEEIRRKTEELSELKAELAREAVYKEGCRTGHLAGNVFAVTVQLRETVKWDQKALESLRGEMGDGDFFKVFRWTFEPDSKKALDAALEYSPWARKIRDAFKASPAAPSVTFKRMEDC
jgi:hypothetical protein